MAKFVRKHPDANGSHRIMVNEKQVEGRGVVKEIVINGRDIYETDDKREIELLASDPEVLEFSKKTKIEVSE